VETITTIVTPTEEVDITIGLLEEEEEEEDTIAIKEEDMIAITIVDLTTEGVHHHPNDLIIDEEEVNPIGLEFIFIQWKRNEHGLKSVVANVRNVHRYLM